MCYNVPCNYVQAIIIVSHIILIVLIKTLTTTTNQLPALDNVQPFLLIISNMKIIQCSCMKQFVVGSTLWKVTILFCIVLEGLNDGWGRQLQLDLPLEVGG